MQGYDFHRTESTAIEPYLQECRRDVKAGRRPKQPRTNSQLKAAFQAGISTIKPAPGEYPDASGWIDPAPLTERQQERLLLTLLKDKTFRNAFNAVLCKRGR